MAMLQTQPFFISNHYLLESGKYLSHETGLENAISVAILPL